VAILAAFVAYERRIAFPSLDVRLFANPRFAASVGSVGLIFFAAMGTLFFMAFYLQLIRGYSPLRTGLLMLPFAAAQMLLAPRSAGLVKRFGPKAVCAFGMALVTASLAALAFIDGDTPVWLLGTIFFVQGAGMANVMPPATESIMASLPRERAGVGSAVGNTVRQVGGALGVAVLGSVLSAAYRHDITGSLANLPAPVRAVARESISGSYGAAALLGPAGVDLVAAANRTFVNAMHYAAWGAALVALLGMVVVLAWLPGRSPAAPRATATGSVGAPDDELELAEA
jgi:Na+/melibiose symporter-like transporter